MPWHLIFIVAAFICFIIDTFRSVIRLNSSLNLTAAGLALLTAALYFVR
jgi:hypothetical protein